MAAPLIVFFGDYKVASATARNQKHRKRPFFSVIHF